ncbi:ganglioside GM2 activator [Biomphalaria pfeifferi]|uniref:Ganglioside GM2 activator n=1 Tax=Biomphalaria pfeifferi TaxID=112525 RepID=A0AAD8BY02_BIOPF|nr:ganglioside GM2 activator [Biomphalaria pfeifferi]
MYKVLIIFFFFSTSSLLLNVVGESIIRRLVMQQVEEFEIRDDKSNLDLAQAQSSFNISDHKLIKFLSDVQKATKYIQHPLTSFSWGVCDTGSTQLAKINSLTLSPDPLTIPGTVSLSFDVELSSNVDAPLQASVTLKKKIGFIWIEVPCIHNLGSCTYNDICERLVGANCPQVFVDHNVPCKCPFPQGHFTIPVTDIPIKSGSVPSGAYKLELKLSVSSALVTCIDISFSIN